MSQIEIRVPELSESVSSAVLARWLVQPGEIAQEGQLLVEIETDKVMLDIAAPCAGRVGEWAAAQGDTVESGALLVRLDASARVAAPLAPTTGPGTPSPRGERRVPMTRLRTRIAQRMLQSQAESATLTTVNEVDLQPLLTLLVEQGVMAGWMPYFVKAAVAALRKYPVLNASVDGNEIVHHDYHDIGIAVSTPRGLVVPVLRDAGALDLAAIGAALDDFGLRARAGRLTVDELTGGTFTISNSGTFGTLFATPIINPPQSAILGVHATVDRPVAIDGQASVRPMKYLSLSYDHRIIDGQEAALFLQEVKMLVERPWHLLDDSVPEPAPAVAAPVIATAVQEAPRATPRGLPARAVSALQPKAAEAVLVAELAALLQVAPQAIDPQAPFVQLGLNSVSAVAWIERVNRAFSIALPATMVYAHPTLSAFARFVADELAHRGTAMPSAPTPTPTPTPAPAPAPTARAREAVAVIGMSGRYASAETLEAYWELLASGGEGVREVPLSRWDNRRHHDPEPYTEGKTLSRWLGWLDKVECFDPLFFGISPAEAELMDPQQRLFLQEAYRAIEDAAIAPASLSDVRCGVYLGLSNCDYAALLRTGPSGIAERLGNSGAITSARIAYHLNLKGPALTLDTACSSSLVALHLACQGLLREETDMALVGAASLFLSPELYICWSNAGMLAPDGRCKTFDDNANGFVAGEGVGAVLLKRLSDAQRDGDRILGVVKASGLNQDGRTNGITAPSMARQAELLRSLYDAQGISAATIGYVETHGTGTHLGDPVELQALTQAFRSDTDERGYCVLGAAKASIGHTSAAAGMAGLHKVLLCLAHGELVPQAHFKAPNRHFDFAASPFRVSTERAAWQPRGGVRRAALSAFGVSGTNAHVVIDEGVPRVSVSQSGAATDLLFVLSARTAERLGVVGARLAAHLRKHPGLDLRDVAHTLRVGRDAMEHRAAFMAGNLAEVLRTLDDLAAARASHGLHVGRTSAPLPVAQGATPMQGLALAWVQGAATLDAIAEGGLRIALPTYPFAEERHWAEGIGGPIVYPDHLPQASAGVVLREPLDAQMSQLIDELVAGRLDVETVAQRLEGHLTVETSNDTWP
jgi:pyruvate/2-oxoglutarate dehydrogenase complex dihydrolipoamide acyltransferase (E2) component/3-oxoacyl-(acyl-carrier-protein) synthase/aryl carrier-like protein